MALTRALQAVPNAHARFKPKPVAKLSLAEVRKQSTLVDAENFLLEKRDKSIGPETTTPKIYQPPMIVRILL